MLQESFSYILLYPDSLGDVIFFLDVSQEKIQAGDLITLSLKELSVINSEFRRFSMDPGTYVFDNHVEREKDIIVKVSWIHSALTSWHPEW